MSGGGLGVPMLRAVKTSFVVAVESSDAPELKSVRRGRTFVLGSEASIASFSVSGVVKSSFSSPPVSFEPGFNAK